VSPLPAFIHETVAVLAPLLPAALGGLATDRVGVLNIALEGLMMAGGFAYVAVGAHFGPVAGLAAAMAAGVAASWTLDAFVRRSRSDPFVAGLALNLLVPALASIASEFLFGTKGVVSVLALASLRIGNFRASDWAALAFASLAILVLGFTPFGLRTRACGTSPDALRLAGLDPGRIRGQAYAFAGMACGVSGAVLAAAIGAWVPSLSAGRGWIALVAVYLGGRRLGGTLAATAGFAILLAAATRAQAFAFLPSELLLAAPYALTAVVVILGAAGARGRDGSGGR